MKPIVIVMKALVAVVFVWMLIMFFNIIDFQIIQLSSINELITVVRNIINYGYCTFTHYLFQGAHLLSNIAFNPAAQIMGIRFYDADFQSNIMSLIWLEMIDNFNPYFYDIQTDPLNWTTITYNVYINLGLILKDLTTLWGELYILIFQVCAIFMILYGILSVVGNDPKNSIRAVTFLNLMIVIPLFFVGIQTLIQVFEPGFNMSEKLGIYNDELVPPLLNLLPYPLNSTLIYQSITSRIDVFLTSPMFLIALSSFIYLELSFQLNYVHQVTSPIEERRQRLMDQLEVIKRAARSAGIDLANLEQEESQKKEEDKKLVMDENGNIVEQKKSETVRKFLAKTATGFSFITEMIEKRKIEQLAKKQIEALKDTRRLSNYLNKLLSTDPEAEMTLTAKSSAPKSGKLITSTIVDFAVRVFGISILVFFVAQTPWLLEEVFMAPPSIIESVEMFTPEVILTVFIPFILLFPFISVIIRQTKAQHLRKKLQAEKDRQREAQEHTRLIIA